MNAKEKLVAAYVRVSTASQNEEGQREEIQRWLLGNGIGVEGVRWFVDKKSGDTLKRPAFNELKAAIFAGEVSTVVCFKLDRISRSLRDGVNVLADWCKLGIRVVSTSQQLDFNGTIGELLAAVLFAVAAMEQETRKERQACGIAIAKKAGKYKGRRKGTTKVKPKRAQRLREKGLSLSEIAKAMDVSKNTVCRYLRTVKAQPSN